MAARAPERDDDVEAAEIARLCLAAFDRLPPRGKPSACDEWTVLAGAVLSRVAQPRPERRCVALATGTRCLGVGVLPRRGEALLDMHAEVLVRRLVMRWLTAAAERRDATLLSWREDESRFALADGLSLHLFVSHTPCGDASIYDLEAPPVCRGSSVRSGDEGARAPSRDDDKEEKREHDEAAAAASSRSPQSVAEAEQFSRDGDSEMPAKRARVDAGPPRSQGDTNRTGARPVEGETPDPRSAGADFHALGTLRRKPGRSDLPAHLQSTSMSCSDKLALWARCGLQGALLSRIMGPVLYESVVVTVPRAAQGAKKAAHDAIERALVGRFGRPRAVAGTAAPRVAVTSERFDYEKSGERIRASGFSLLWAEDDVSRVEVVAGALGLLQGATSKSAVSPRTWPSVCKMSLARRALALWDRHGIVAPAPPRVYRACKESARDYCDDKRSLQGAEGPMRNWSHAPAQVDDFVVGD